jgi:hypothetical protein
MEYVSLAATFVSLGLALLVAIRVLTTPRDQWNRLILPMGLMALLSVVAMLTA